MRRRRRWRSHWLTRVGRLPQALATLATEAGLCFGRGATGRAALFQGLSTVLTKEGIILVGRLTGSTDHSPASHDVGQHPKKMGKTRSNRSYLYRRYRRRSSSYHATLLHARTCCFACGSREVDTGSLIAARLSSRTPHRSTCRRLPVQHSRRRGVQGTVAK